MKASRTFPVFKVAFLTAALLAGGYSRAEAPAPVATPHHSGHVRHAAGAEVRLLQDALDRSLSQPVVRVEDLESLELARIEKQFETLPRSVSMSDIREAKIAMIHWRHSTVRKLVAFALEASDADFLKAVTALNQLSIELDGHQYLALEERLKELTPGPLKAAARQALNSQQPLVENGFIDSVRYASDLRYKIVATRHFESQDNPNRTPTEPKDHSHIRDWAWQTEKAMDRKIIRPEPSAGEGAYRVRDHLIVKPGDIVLLEQNTDFCTDLNTSVSMPISLFSHAAVFLEVEHDGKKLPAVLEVYSHGLRIVPAELYLGRRFSHYTEIHRFKEATPEWPRKLRELAKKYEKEKNDWCYDFYAKEFSQDDKNRERTANCANLPSHVLIELGCDPISSRCEVVEGARDLLSQLGLPFEKYLTPSDYRRDPRLELAGVLDSLNLESVLSLELVVRNPEVKHSAAGILSQCKWKESEMPYMYSAKVSLISGVYSRNWLAKQAVNKTTEWPWTFENFPKAPPKVISFIGTIDPVIGGEMRKLRDELVTQPFHREVRPTIQPSSKRSPGAEHLLNVIEKGHDGHRWLSISALENDPKVQEDITERLKPLEKWLSRP